MTFNWKWVLGIGVSAILAGFIFGFTLKGRIASSKVNGLVQQASVLQGQINETKAQADALKIKDDANAVVVQKAKVKVASLQQQVDQDQHDLLEMSAAEAITKSDPAKDALIVGLRKTVDDQGQLIGSLKVEGAAKDVRIKGLEDYTVVLKKIGDDAQAQARMREIALGAQVQATTSARWSGRFQGFGTAVLAEGIRLLAKR